MYANFLDYTLNLLQILKGFWSAPRVAQQGCRMVERSHPYAVFFCPMSVLLRYFEILADYRHRRNPSETDNYLGANELCLLPEPVDAGVLLDTERVAVKRRAAFDHVGNIYISTVKVDYREHIVQ